MIYYLNLGFVVEQALRDVIATYIDRLRLDDVYENFHISVINDHPFAHMIIENNPRCADNFPAVIITSENDSKSSELINVPPQIMGVGFTSDDLDNLINSTTRIKTRINENGEEEEVIKRGVKVRESIPGYILVCDSTAIEQLKEIADSRTIEEQKGMVYGVKYNTRRKDRISIEIWSENNQLKNELYEHLRILCSNSLDRVLQDKYSMFDPCVFDGTINGERSANYNFDFDTLLNGSHISFDIEYNVAQIILDTEITNKSKEILLEVINHVKE